MTSNAVRSSPRQDRRKARTRDRIIDAAQTQFTSDGDAATIERIADVADVAVATIYQHFSGKDDLYYAVVERAVEQYERYMDVVYGSPTDPVQKIIDAAGAYQRFYLDSPQLFHMVQAPPVDSGGTAAAALVAARIKRMNYGFALVLEDGIGRGDLRKISVTDTVHALWGTMNGLLGLAGRSDRLRLSDPALASAFAQSLEIILEGLVTDKHRGPDGRLAAPLRDRVQTVVG